MGVEPRQVVVVSGGSRGLGQALCADFLARGCIVAAFSRTWSAFIETQQQRDPHEESFHWASLDGTDHEQVKQFVLGVARRYGKIDVLINNAGVGLGGLLALARSEDVHRLVALNLEAAVHLTQACARVMLDQDGGVILSISSVNALRGHTGVAVYSATKAALDGLTRSLARELGPRGIRVNSLAPGYFASDMVRGLSDEQRRQIVRRTPLQRLAEIDDIVGVVRFLTGPEARFITGQTIVVDGGLTC